MARVALTAAAALLLLACTAEAARIMVDADVTSSGRALLQGMSTSCSSIPNCAKCRNQRVPGSSTSELICSTCNANYRLVRTGANRFKACEAAPGFFIDGSTLTNCTSGKYCPGGNTAVTCPDGLETTVARAKSIAQCNTKAGFGRVATRGSDGKITVTGQQCPQGTYNVGNNQAACQKCGAGLTTSAPPADTSLAGATGADACAAPAGSYKDRGVAKRCPKGTKSPAGATSCTPCGTGLTTASDGTPSTGDCLVQKGFYLNGADVEPCPLHTYQATDAAGVTSCTNCTAGMKTLTTGATSAAECLFPPGTYNASGTPTACADGYYKESWSDVACTACGTGLTTGGATGSVSKAACLVPAGYGLTSAASATVWVAAVCEKGTYGVNEARPAVSNVRCLPCAANLYTLDQLTASYLVAPGGGTAETRVGFYTAETACVAAAGWGLSAAGAEECPIGTYSVGGTRDACTACATGKTTADTGSDAAADCIVRAGWEIVDSVLRPCAVGSYSAAGDANCTACPAGKTTQDDESTVIGDCDVCAEGHGGDSCADCPANTFAAGGAAVGVNCTACASGTVSRSGATDDTMCHDQIQSWKLDALELSNTTKWSAQAETTLETCQNACKASGTCIMFRFTDADPDTCDFLVEDNADTAKLGIKVGNGAEYVIRKFPAGVTAGDQIGSVNTVTSDDTAACQALCHAEPACEAFVLDATACTLRKSALLQGVTSMYVVKLA